MNKPFPHKLPLLISFFFLVLFQWQPAYAGPQDSLMPHADSMGRNSTAAFRKYAPFWDTSVRRFRLRNEIAPFRVKLFRASMLSMGYNSVVVGLLLAVPRDFSKWDKPDYRGQFKHTFTHPPVIDDDHWYINYLGHPYQGAFYYNNLRSQGARVWQAGLYCWANSWLWEYLFEGGFEQPSIQDMVVTPVAGVLLGELFHFGSVRMSRNGFKWYEKMVVCILDPNFAINNGFKYAAKPDPKALLP